MARDDDDPRAPYNVYERNECKGTYATRADAGLFLVGRQLRAASGLLLGGTGRADVAAVAERRSDYNVMTITARMRDLCSTKAQPVGCPLRASMALNR